MGMYCGDEEILGLPKQQKPQQPQQQIIVEEQQLPLRTSATPVCDTTMQKQEASDEKNDFGMSPEDDSSDSTSPMSEQFFSVDNCDLSPESDSWPDSNHPKSNNTDYNNTHEMFNQCRISQDLQTINDSDHASKGDAWSESFQCPVCKEISINRDSFSEHLISHYGNRSECLDIRNNETDSPVPGPSGVNQRRSSRNRSEQLENNGTEEIGLRVPRVNSQGRVKTFRCKQCSFVSVTKPQFWSHNRLHIRADKLLMCPNCPFVTEYKHHLEYHLRNHYGSKPFKCDKCSYTCVNKSMLNSHLKSHSNIYQYRCADCVYVTKYCHSLKLHLRKYTHLPAMVLNADGSPNPLPIIDIYGTRRGPKNKTKAQRVHAKTTRTNRANRSENAKRSSPQELKPTTKTSTITSFETSMNLTGARPFTINMVSDEDARTNSVVNDANTESRSSLIAHNPVSNDISVPNQNPVEETQERLIPLDLSIREQPNCNENINDIDQTNTKLISSIKARSSSRRKGKAYKLDRRQVFSENESDEYITVKSSQVSEFITIEKMHMPNIENDIKKYYSEDPLKNHQSEDSSENHTILRLGNHQFENPTKNHEKAGSSNDYQSIIFCKNHSENHKSVGNETAFLKKFSIYKNPSPYIQFKPPYNRLDPCKSCDRINKAELDFLTDN